jgi:hypothetical protein
MRSPKVEAAGALRQPGWIPRTVQANAWNTLKHEEK